MVLQFYKNEPNEPSKLNCLKCFFPHLVVIITNDLDPKVCWPVSDKWDPSTECLQGFLYVTSLKFNNNNTRTKSKSTFFKILKKKEEEKKRVQSVCDDIQVETMEYYNFKLDHRKLKVIEWGRSQQGHNMVTCIFLSM